MIEYPNSKIELGSSILIESQFLSVLPKKEKESPEKGLLDKHVIEIDFTDITINETMLQCDLKIKIEPNKDFEYGYKILTHHAAMFNYNEDSELKEKARISGISILISISREFIRTLTKDGIYGQFLLPLVDPRELLKKKNKQIEKKKKNSK